MSKFKKLTTHYLHMICQQDYSTAMKIYNILMDKRITFQRWEDQYRFEAMSSSTLPHVKAVLEVYNQNLAGNNPNITC